MSGMPRAWPRIRAFSLLVAGAIAVHELRYLAGYGPGSGEALAQQGHSYLTTVFALTTILLAIGAIRFAISLGRAARGHVTAERAPRLARLWLTFSCVLAGVYVLQEGFEGSFAPGHPAGVVGIFGHGGWTALIFAALIGGVIALITRLAHETLEYLVRRSAQRPPRPVTRPSWTVLPEPPAPRRTLLAWNLAGRAPPVA
jgi:hypothetical protein